MTGTLPDSTAVNDNTDGVRRRKAAEKSSLAGNDCPSSPPAKAARLDEGSCVSQIASTGASAAQPDALVWSWPRRVDQIASGPYSDCIAVTDDTGAKLTWAQLAAKSKVVAQSLKVNGLTGTPVPAYAQCASDKVVAASPVVIMMSHSADGLAVLLGVLRQGFPVLPLSVMHADKKQLLKRYEEAMELFQPTAIVSSSPMAQHLLEHRPNTTIIDPQRLLSSSESVADYQDVETTCDNVLAYIFTSGSSGKSKCVTATNRMAWAEVQMYPQVFQKLGIKVDPRKDRWRQDHEMGWWGAAFFGEVDVALAMMAGIVMMKPNDVDLVGRGVTMMGALPSQLQNLWPGAVNPPKTLRVIFSWAERCDVDLGQLWKKQGVRVADLLIASEYWLSLASCNLEVFRGEDGRAAHAMRAVEGADILILDDHFCSQDAKDGNEVVGLLGIRGPTVSPGYVERLSDGSVTIGGGALSQDGFKWINGEWVVVPKDIIKRRPDNSFLSVGRAGGTVKVRGGVLMSTSVVELQLQEGPIQAACITDPIHVEGGNSVVLQAEWQSEWSLRQSLEKASFLRMPILFVCEMPRNASTGKVQKALVQRTMEQEHEAEQQFNNTTYSTQEAQLRWYARIALPFIAVCSVQPLTMLDLFNSVMNKDLRAALSAVLGFPGEMVIRWSLVSWIYGASCHAGTLGRTSSLTMLFGFLSSALASPRLLVPACLVSLVGAMGALQSREDKEGILASIIGRVDRLSFATVLALALRSPWCQGVTSPFCAGLLSIFAASRCLPSAPWKVGAFSFVLQRLLALMGSFAESTMYMASYTIAFAFVLPSIVLAKYPQYAWSHLKQPGEQVPKKSSEWPFEGPREQKQKVSSQWGSDGAAWIDVEGDFTASDTKEEKKDTVMAETPAGVRAQALARQAGVDFLSVDSLRISRLSVLIKKHLKHKPNEEALEFPELREACGNEQSFVNLIDSRMDVAESSEADAVATASRSSWLWRLMTWVRGGSFVHREGATQAPWDCRVDMTVEWKGEEPLDRGVLLDAYNDVIQQHPMLRALPPPDDKVDSLMGTGRNDFSTTAAGTWTLLTAIWSRNKSWTSRSSQIARKVVSKALWHCWPRTLVTEQDTRYRFDIPEVSGVSSAWSKTYADDVSNILNQNWESWWSSKTSVVTCMVNLHKEDSAAAPTQYLYCSMTHKYADGGAVSAFLQSLRECYEARLKGEKPSNSEHPVLRVNQQRLARYLSGDACPQGAVDVYLFDINNDTFYNELGYSSGAYFTDGVCNLLRTVGLRLACSEEIAWLACITCAMCRLMPDEKVLKIMIVHNGRMGEAEGAVACVSQYVMLSIPCANERSNTPLADIASRVKFAITHGKFTRPAPCEQSHAKINIGGQAGRDGNFSQVFKRHKCKKSSQSRAPHVIQLRMDNECGTWCVKDFKCLARFDGCKFWEMTVCAALEIADGWFNHPLSSS